MGVTTKIAWTDHTANPWWGCTRVSEGCQNCYAELLSQRTGRELWGAGAPRQVMKSIWQDIRQWALAAARAGVRRRVFLGSMMDIAEDRPDLVEPRKRFCGLIEELEDLDFLLLTKRPENYLRLMPWGKSRWPANAWALASAENQFRLEQRMEHLLNVDAAVRGLLCEPLLGPLALHDHWVEDEFCATLLHWVIVGGESGSQARACHVEWVREVVQQCRAAGVPVFVKQLGAHALCGDADRERHPDGTLFTEGVQRNTWHMKLQDRKGGDPAEWPADLRVQERPLTPGGGAGTSNSLKTGAKP